MADVKARNADVDTDALGHTPGVKQGNSKGNYEKNGGHLPDGKRNARASTGVNPDARNPIDPSMPNLSPA
jgi:hypothetical protein